MGIKILHKLLNLEHSIERRDEETKGWGDLGVVQLMTDCVRW